MSRNLEKLSKQQLLEEIRLLQSHSDKQPSDSENKDDILHELQVHQIELEMQNRELRESQQQLEETRDNYADLYDFAPVNYFTFDNEGLIKNLNLTAASMIGKYRTNIIGCSFAKWLDKTSTNQFHKHLRTIFESNVKISDELKLINEEGICLDIRIESIRTKYSANNEYECRSVILDITESNKIKNKLFLQARQLKLITDALPVLIAYIDRDEKHLFANKSYIDSFDTSFEDVIGFSALEVWGEDTYEKINKLFRFAMAGQLMNFEMELPLGGSGKKYFHATLIPDSNDNSEVYGVIVLIGDITNRLSVESIDRKRLLEAAHVNRLNTMGEMATEIAHELNQPLAAISIYSDACRRLLLSDNDGIKKKNKVIESLTVINNLAERAGDIIRRIREFTTKKDLQRMNVNINKLIEEALGLLKVEIRAHNVDYKLSLSENLSEISIDKILVEQVIFNLIRNALEAMASVDLHQRVLTITTSKGQFNEVEVSISDTGPGMSNKEIKHIFEPFQTSKKDGMGMGLTISQSIIEAHRGRIWAVQNDNGGTTFVFTLPKDIEDKTNAA